MKSSSAPLSITDGHWPTMSLREANVTLIDCDHRTPPASDTGYPYVAIPQLQQGRIDMSAARRITRDHFQEWTRKARPIMHDVILSRRCNPGETAYVSGDVEFALGQNLVLLRADGKKIHPPFLRWLVRGPEWWEQIAKYLNVGAVFDSLRCADVPKFQLRVPPLRDQRAIAGVLGALDDKIELNRRMSETLEAMARALFKSWFVDFDPVRAKSEGRDAVLPGNVDALVPMRLIDSPLGAVPQGWRIAALGTLIEVVRGLSYNGAGLSDAGKPMHNLNSIFEGGGYKDDGIKYYTGDFKAHHVAVAGDVIVANTEQGHDRLLIGHAAIIPVRFDEGLFSHHTYRVRPKPESTLTSDYLAHLLNTEAMHDLVSGFANGTTVNMLPIDGLTQPLIVVPPDEMIASFSDLSRTSRMRIEMMRAESRTLTALRDTLLPKLISGELRVPDAERLAEEALTT